MIVDVALLVLGLSLSLLPPHFFFQKLFDYVLSLKSREMYSAKKPGIYRATKGHFWFASHWLLFFQSILILFISNRLFNHDIALLIAVGWVFVSYLFIVGAFDFRFSYLISLFFAVSVYFIGFWTLGFLIIFLGLFFVFTSLELVLYISLLVLCLFIALTTSTGFSIILFIQLFTFLALKFFVLAKKTSLDWTVRLKHR